MKHKWLVILLVLLSSCRGDFTPKPEGYLKIHYPEKEYVLFDDAAPYSFEYPVYANVQESKSRLKEAFWYDIEFPEYEGTIFVSYKSLNGNVEDLIEDSRTLVYKHASRSDGIVETPFIDTVNKRYGLLYDLEGNVASSVQFFMTDSVNHFFRASLYFNTSPNKDSLKPVILFVREDIEHMIESLQWKY